MIVYLLWRRNEDDYYVKVCELEGIFTTRRKAVNAYKVMLCPKEPLDPETKPYYGTWYEIEEATVDRRWQQ